MIESRYSIEYIDPNSEKPSSKLGRFLIYSTLIISIFVAIGALVFSNLPTNTPQIITNKVQQFISSFNEPSISLPVKKEVSSDTDTVRLTNEELKKHADTKNELAQQKLAATQLEDEYKKEIERLSQENTSQHNETVKQLTENQALTKKSDLLSKQLKKEIQKSALLDKEVTSLQAENKKISSLLKITEEMAGNYADEIKKLGEDEVKLIIQAEPSIIKSITLEEPAEEKKVELKVSATKEAIKPTEDTSATNKSKAPTSQIDAIVAAMEAAKSTPNSSQNTATNDSTVNKDP